MADPENGFFRLPDGAEIAFQIRGRGHAGTPVLLVRPLGGSTALWGSFRALLAERFRVVSYDHRGAGRSSPAAGAGFRGTRALALDARAVLDHLGVDSAHVFGISLGGMAATWLAILEPDRVARLCIAAAPARGLDAARAGLRNAAHAAALAVSFGRPRGEVEPALVRRVLSRRFRDDAPEAVRRIEAPARAEPAGRAALLRQALAGALHDARAELHRIRAPTLVLAGERDTLVGAGPPAALAAAIPGAVFEVIPGAGHDLTLEQPVVTAERVARFFAEG